MPLLDDMRITRLSRTLPVRLLIALSQAVGYCLPFYNRSSLFFFFPFLHVGGAERVHGALTGCVADRHPWVFFTKRSENRAFRPLFPERARLCNIWYLLKYGYPFSVGIMAGLINRHRAPVVFGSNSLFYYLLLPHLRQGVKRIDLLHAFGGGPENFSLGTAHLLDRRVVITPRTRDDLADQYRTGGLDETLLQRVLLIENRVQVPPELPRRRDDTSLTVLFVGRGSPEKRVHLVGKAARRCRDLGLPARFTLVGDVEQVLEADEREACLLLGEVTDPRRMAGIYDEARVLLLTSSREGFPLVVMEAMARGVVPLCTAVGGIPEHVRHDDNGLLLHEKEEERLVEEIVQAIGCLIAAPPLLERLSRSAYDYARTRFDSGSFCRAYRELLLGEGE